MKKYRLELNYVRVLLCVMIVVTHVLTEYTNAHSNNAAQLETLYWIRMLFIFGTPGFVMLTQLIFTLNLQGLPDNYLRRRLQYVFIPYIVMGAFYSYSEAIYLRKPFITQFVENVLKGQWYGYFILIILKFFILNVVIMKLWPKLLSSRTAVVIAILINIVYLSVYHHNTVVSDWIDNTYFFEANTVLLGWIGYYFVGSYIGSHYERLKAYFEDYGLFFIGITLLAFILFVMTGDHDFADVTSNNAYILLYCISAFFYIIHFSIKVQGMLLEAVTLISTYSFFIYLFHPIILQYVYAYTERFEGSTLLFMLFSVLLTFGVCIGVGSLLRTFSIFKYVMGTQPYR